MFALEIIKQLNSDECKRCGSCCQELVGKDFWKQSRLTEKQKTILLKKRKNYPQNGKGCDMLISEDLVSTCLLQKLFGYKILSDNCRNYPKPRHKYCLREKNMLGK